MRAWVVKFFLERQETRGVSSTVSFFGGFRSNHHDMPSMYPCVTICSQPLGALLHRTQRVSLPSNPTRLSLEGLRRKGSEGSQTLRAAPSLWSPFFGKQAKACRQKIALCCGPKTTRAAKGVRLSMCSRRSTQRPFLASCLLFFNCGALWHSRFQLFSRTHSRPPCTLLTQACLS